MFNLRLMQEGDISDVLEIEENVCDYPWTESIFLDCLRVGYDCLVLEDSNNHNKVVGFGLMTVAANEAHILNLNIAQELQRQGLGTKIMQHLLDLAKDKKSTVVYLEVRQSNSSAGELYRRLNFAEIGIRKNYYPTNRGREDAVILALDLGVESKHP